MLALRKWSRRAEAPMSHKHENLLRTNGRGLLLIRAFGDDGCRSGEAGWLVPLPVGAFAEGVLLHRAG